MAQGKFLHYLISRQLEEAAPDDKAGRKSLEDALKQVDQYYPDVASGDSSSRTNSQRDGTQQAAMPDRHSELLK